MGLEKRRFRTHRFRTYLNRFQAKTLQVSHAITTSQSRDNRMLFEATWLQSCETHTKWHSFQKNEFILGIV